MTSKSSFNLSFLTTINWFYFSVSSFINLSSLFLGLHLSLAFPPHMEKMHFILKLLFKRKLPLCCSFCSLCSSHPDSLTIYLFSYTSLIWDCISNKPPKSAVIFTSTHFGTREMCDCIYIHAFCVYTSIQTLKILQVFFLSFLTIWPYWCCLL